MNNHPHVAYFSNQFADKDGHGIARYSRELFNSLHDISGVTVTPVAAWSGLKKPVYEQLVKDTGLRLLPLGRRMTPLCWAFVDYPPIEHLLGSEIDVVHAVSLGYPIATNKPYMVTVHDIGPLTHPQYFRNKPPWIMKRALNQMLAKADAIVCVSQATADDLSCYAGQRLKSERIHIIGEGVSPIFIGSDEQHDDDDSTAGHMLPDDVPFLLVTGKISPRKNIEGVLKAFMSITDKIAHHLVFVGGIGWDADNALELMKHSAISDRIHMVGYLTDLQLKGLYNNASAYIHPSLFEGFGLTVLEAMACGCPVITSNRYSLPEVAGNAALLIDPEKIEAIADAIVSVCTDTQLADNLRRMGYEQVKKFSWKNIADKIAEVYQSIA